ncbi:Leukocyte surface antigen CD47 [Amazona aestiva]|uniref:Leukocyte surface antigen CD47 n=1 Tax=Amazona aestiva TaxID=12930 RepID=A0A0Q3PCY7_AMAAE|nr:Leukocyte surface antigen CD47 [Amazona aestiva]
MWLLSAWVLLSAVGAGSAQLIFSGTDAVERTDCNKTVILPCYVTNLKENNTNVMFVTWKKQGKIIFSFDGRKQEFFRDPEFPSADLVSQADLPKGIASLMLNGSWFLLMERAIIIALLFLVITLCAAQLSAIVLKYETVPQKKTGIFVAIAAFVVAAVVGTVLFVQDGYTAQNQAGLGLIVVPAVILVPLQYVMFGIVFDSLPQATFALIGLHILGYVIAVVGFALCVSACPPLHGSVVIAGLAIMAIANLLSLAYVFIMGRVFGDEQEQGNQGENEGLRVYQSRKETETWKKTLSLLQALLRIIEIVKAGDC